MCPKFVYLPLLFILFLLSSCSTPPQATVSQGYSESFRYGYPEVRLSAAGWINDNQETQLKLFVDVGIESIITSTNDEGVKVGMFTLELEMINRTTGGSSRVSYVFSMSENDPLLEEDRQYYPINKTLLVEPGEYEVFANISDNSSKKTSTARAVTSVPDINNLATEFSTVLIRGLNYNNNEIASAKIQSSYNVPHRYDSLQFVVQVYNSKDRVPDQLSVEIVSYPSDNDAARMPYDPNILAGNIAFRGVDYTETTSIYSEIGAKSYLKEGVHLYSIVIPMMSNGTYQFNIEATFSDGSTLSQNRMFGVKSPWFPKIQTPIELAAPLIYLMKEKDHEKMMRLSTPDSIKRAVDTFWLKSIKDKSQAKRTIARFYQRVEEANRQFTSFKEGWKTDPGMIYILWGPPRFVRRNFQDIIWIYGFYQSPTYFDPESTFTFYRAQPIQKEYPFNHFILRRNNAYFQAYTRIVDDWKNGMIF